MKYLFCIIERLAAYFRDWIKKKLVSGWVMHMSVNGDYVENKGR